MNDDEAPPMDQIRRYVEEYRENQNPEADLETIVHQWIREWAHKITMDDR